MAPTPPPNTAKPIQPSFFGAYRFQRLVLDDRPLIAGAGDLDGSFDEDGVYLSGNVLSPDLVYTPVAAPVPPSPIFLPENSAVLEEDPVVIVDPDKSSTRILREAQERHTACRIPRAGHA